MSDDNKAVLWTLAIANLIGAALFWVSYAAARLSLVLIIADTLAHAVDGLMSPDVPGTQRDNGGHSGTLAP